MGLHCIAGPELMDSAQTVLKSMGVPIDFEVLHFSEVNRGVVVMFIHYIYSVPTVKSSIFKLPTHTHTT